MPGGRFIDLTTGEQAYVAGDDDDADDAPSTLTPTNTPRAQELARDPSHLTDREVILGLLVELDDEICSITRELDTAAMAWLIEPPSPAAVAWAKRATYARAMRYQAKHRLILRERELRGIARDIENARSGKKDPVVLAAREVRLAEEAARGRVAREAEVLKLKNQREELQVRAQRMGEMRSINRIFVEIMRERMLASDFEAVMEEVKRRRPPAD
jgi:hypothetical protein